MFNNIKHDCNTFIIYLLIQSINVIRKSGEGEGGSKERENLLTFFPWKEEEGCLLEELQSWYMHM